MNKIRALWAKTTSRWHDDAALREQAPTVPAMSSAPYGRSGMLLTRRLAAACAVCLAGSLNTSCSSSAPAALAAATTAEATGTPAIRRVRIVISIDQTDSIEKHGVHPPSPDDLLPLLDQLRTHSGELGVAAIRCNSAACRLIRVTLPPAEPSLTEPALPANRLARSRVERKRNEDKAAWGAREAMRQEECTQRISTFMNEVRDLLAMPVEKKCTDMVGAVAKANMFLTEPGAGATPDESFYICVSDARHSGSKATPPVWSVPGARILLVSGDANPGYLASLEPLRFEAFGAAVAYIQGEVK